MNTDNSHQVVATGDVVTDFVVPPVPIRSCLAGMCYVTTLMATPEVKPKEHFHWKQNWYLFKIVGLVKIDMICQMKEQVITMSTDHVHASFVYNINNISKHTVQSVC